MAEKLDRVHAETLRSPKASHIQYDNFVMQLHFYTLLFASSCLAMLSNSIRLAKCSKLVISS